MTIPTPGSGVSSHFRQVAALETEAHLRVMGGPDATEGVAAYLERRPPNWTAAVSRDWRDLSL